MTNLTHEDVPTLQRLAEFFTDRKDGRCVIGEALCKAFASLCLRMVVSINHNGAISHDDEFDAVGRVKPKEQR